MNKVWSSIRLLRYLTIVASIVLVGLFLTVQSPADPCGVNDKKWATESKMYTVCVDIDDTDCGTPRTETGTNCIPTSANRECLLSVIECNAQCTYNIPNGWGTCASQPFGGGGGGEENPECDPIDRQTCEAGWDEASCQCGYSPVLISMDGNQMKLTNPAQGVEFDLNGDGAMERTGWPMPGGGDGFLALDRNLNGRIDNGLELFGNFTEQPEETERNGFLALAVLDQESKGGNDDGQITAADAAYRDLLLWIDQNHDGISQAEELFSLDRFGLSAISLSYRESRRRDRHGNEFRYSSRVYFESSAPGPKKGFAIDVFFAVDPD